MDQERGCSADLTGDPEALVACGYNPDFIKVEVGRYITADMGCETARAYRWESAVDGKLPEDMLAFFAYQAGYANQAYYVCRSALLRCLVTSRILISFSRA